MPTNTDIKKYLELSESLRREKTELEQRLAEINAALAGVPKIATAAAVVAAAAPAVVAAAPAPAAPARRGRRPGPAKRAKNELSLKEVVRKVTARRPLTKAEILDAVAKEGYVFTASNPLNSLNVTLYTKGLFKNDKGRFSPLK